jgi:hypothetical protein
VWLATLADQRHDARGRAKPAVLSAVICGISIERRRLPGRGAAGQETAWYRAHWRNRAASGMPSLGLSRISGVDGSSGGMGDFVASGPAGDLGPGLKGLGPGGSTLAGGDVIAAEMKEVIDLVVGGEEALRLAG